MRRRFRHADVLTRLPSFTRITRAAIAAALLMPVPASAQDVTEPALKAAFIYNFAKFTEWPPEDRADRGAARHVRGRRRRRRRGALANGQGP